MSARAHPEVVLMVLAVYFCVISEAGVQVGFYKRDCPQAESIVRSVVQEALKRDIGLAANFVRLQFHDCFVRGCDASILLDSTRGSSAEKDSPVNNPRLGGYDVLDAIKSKLEDTCPGVVSCADIIAFAARDSIHMSGGLHYEVPAGRRDGNVSRSSEVSKHVPAPTHDLAQLEKSFAGKRLTLEDVVVLSGAHTIGRASCGSFRNRLFSSGETGKQEASLDPAFASRLKKLCRGSGNVNATVAMDEVTPQLLDASYFRNVLRHHVVFTSDQSLLSSGETKRLVEKYAQDDALFRKEFAAAMVKMGTIDVKTSMHGEIRRNCRVLN